MPTIDQLAPATAASDDDELIVSQSGIARKVTRAQVLAGVQPEVAIGQGKLLGRSSTGVGGPEQINVGANLSLTNGTLSANATPFVVASLTAGTVPASGDLVPLGQNGGNAAVTYSQFMNGLAGITNVDVSQLLVTPTGGKSQTKLGDFTANTLSLSGGTLTGTLTLAADPISTLQAATKKYVDTQVATTLPKTGGTLSGALTLSGDPTASLQTATKQYVDGQVATSLSKSGGTLTGTLTLTGALTLAGDPAGSLQATTKQYVDTQVSTALPKAGGALSGALTLAGDPTSFLQPATKQYVDGQISAVLPRSGGTLSGALNLAADPATSLQAATKQYGDARVSRSGDTLTGALVLAGDPTASLQAATKQYVDSQVGATLPKAGGTLTGALTLVADPSSSMHASTKRYVDAQVAVSLPLGGGTLAGPLTLSANPTSALQASPKQYVDSQVATALPVIGGTLTGALTLAADPTSSLHAATKRYVDAASGVSTGVINVRSSPYNAQLNGVADDTAAFKAAYQAARAGSVIYVPNGTTVLQNPGNWGISLTKRVKWVVDGTSLPDGTALADGIPGGGSPANNYLPGIIVGNSGQSAAISQTGSQGSDFSVQHSSYVVNHTGGPTGGAVISNARNDTIIYSAPNNFVWGGLDRLLWCGTQTPSAAYTAEHVGRYVQTIRQSIGTDSSGKPLPQPHLWAACLEYRDTTGQPSSWAASSITIEMDWFGNGPDDGNRRQIQSLVVGQHDTSGAPVEVSSVIGVYLAGGSSGHVYDVFNVCVPFSKAVLDTTAAQQMSGGAAIRMAAGHAIAFEPTNGCRLAYDSATNTLRWNQGTLSYPVGKGISVGWLNVYSSSATLPNYVSGNMIFLVGSGAPYTITLPPASTVAAGTGFTFSVLNNANVNIALTGSDAIDVGPVILHPNDRYHVVSDGYGNWHEIFRTNTVSPVLTTFSVGALPGVYSAGTPAYAANGRKPGEPAGAGTGVQVFFDGSRWISVCSGSQVLA